MLFSYYGRPRTRHDLKTIVAETIDVTNKQLIEPSICAEYLPGNAAWKGNPEYMIDDMKCFYDGSAAECDFTVTIGINSRRFCPCTAGNELTIQ